ncbi:MAG TPA: 30S ribosomal protein S9 [bacterium]|nr:30S ribosomal protein S9 [bacterium]HRU32139.1 30S ribosomal protein S9 [bacterium]
MIGNYYWGTGRRKESVARVRITEGDGKIVINGDKELQDYFSLERWQTQILSPFRITGTEGRFDCYVNVNGGGVNGQAEAVRLGVSRALVEYNPEFRPVLKEYGLLTRDPRMKERKKYGLKRARKAPQFSKR